jgi:hypothetical protein
VVRVGVTRAGSYVFRCLGDLYPYGYLYNSTFQPIKPENNLITYSAGYSSGSFVLRADLDVSNAYFLVVTTVQPVTIGAFNLTITGIAEVTLTRQNCEFNIGGVSIVSMVSLNSFNAFEHTLFVGVDR